jgi:dTDP-glucose 4,6-dehydratase
MARILVTGGSGFIGTNLVLGLLKNGHEVLNLDKLTYAAYLPTPKDIRENGAYHLCLGDIADRELVGVTIEDFKPNKIIHLAAESHVDNSIKASDVFIQTNIIGTYNLLECTRQYFNNLTFEQKAGFLFYHISTDEVFGDLADNNQESLFTETTRYAPSSPYSASKASSDHLVQAWHRTYGLPVVISNCSNNYGFYQNPEKLIPKTIQRILKEEPIPIYGQGDQIRDWLYVEDHVSAIEVILERGVIGETYNIGANCEMKNIDLVTKICEIAQHQLQIQPQKVKNFTDLINFVPDRLGHDKRYAIDNTKLKTKLGWMPKTTLEMGLFETIKWYAQL